MKKISILIVFLLFFALSANAEIIVSPAFTKTLKLGMKNDQEVYLLQRVLIKQGFLANNSVPRGNYTTRTKAAVREFQRANFLISDGSVGYRTRLVLNKLFFDNPRYLDSTQVNQSAQSYQPQNQVQTGYTSPWAVSNQSLGGYYTPGGYSYSNYTTISTARPSVIVSYPTPGSSFNAGQGMGIGWSTSNFPNAVTVTLSLVEPSGYGNAVKVITNIATNITNDGYEYWTIPGYISGNNFYILIETKDSVNGNYNISAISSGAFTIVPVSTTTTGSTTGTTTTTTGTTATTTTGTTGSTTGTGWSSTTSTTGGTGTTGSTTGTKTTTGTTTSGTTTSSTTGTTSTTTSSSTTGTSGTGTTTGGSSTGTTSATIGLPPTVISYAVYQNNISQISAMIEGYVDGRGFPTTSWVEYGTSSSNLNMTSFTMSSTSNSAFKTKISNLTADTEYYYKICAKNYTSTTCSAPVLKFKTLKKVGGTSTTGTTTSGTTTSGTTGTTTGTGTTSSTTATAGTTSASITTTTGSSTTSGTTTSGTTGTTTGTGTTGATGTTTGTTGSTTSGSTTGGTTSSSL